MIALLLSGKCMSKTASRNYVRKWPSHCPSRNILGIKYIINKLSAEMCAISEAIKPQPWHWCSNNPLKGTGSFFRTPLVKTAKFIYHWFNQTTQCLCVCFCFFRTGWSLDTSNLTNSLPCCNHLSECNHLCNV